MATVAMLKSNNNCTLLVVVKEEREREIVVDIVVYLFIYLPCFEKQKDLNILRVAFTLIKGFKLIINELGFN